MRDWFGGLSEVGKVGVVVALIPAVGALIGVIITSVTTIATSDGGKSEGDGNGTPSASQSRAPSGDSGAGVEAKPSGAALPSPSASRPKATYTAVYTDQKMQLGLPNFPSVGVLDFDEPASRTLSEGQWKQLKKDAESQGQPLEQDLIYSNDLWGYLMVREGRNAAQIDETPKDAEGCARSANLGGFTEARMSEWPIKLHQKFCFATDKGNIVSAEITRFVGGNRNSVTDPPTQVEFTATMWQRS
ncbi:hypothetical protein [Streptomyces sp. 3211.6]|uniref:hypothetical protein n=1 Tax=Streptomyces sp. 3211.6 TaxID=1938845 RepID=UPI0011E5EC72|nr:hypothetical protein [Streptomyces sp. 3211.6]